MVHVALAGASSGFGLTLLKHFVASKKHEITVLSRSENPTLSAMGVTVKPVDYSSHKSLTKALEGVHTVIVTLASFDDSFWKTQVNLLNAAKQVGVKRFAPSEFAHPTHDGIDLYAPKKIVWEAVQKSGLEYTQFSCGLFMNGLATATPKEETVALAGLRPWNFVANTKSGTADLPGDGSAKLAITEINDICRYVVASVDLDHWDEFSGIASELLSFNEIIAILEDVTKRKFLRKENSQEEMTEAATNPSRRFYEQVRLAIARGEFDLKPTLNSKFPDIHPITVREFAKKWWSGVDLPEPSWDEDKIFSLV